MKHTKEQDESFLISDLASAVETHFSRHLSINEIKSRALKSVKLSGQEEIRRSFDGCSQSDWLVEKMIGEFMASGEINL